MMDLHRTAGGACGSLFGLALAGGSVREHLVFVGVGPEWSLTVPESKRARARFPDPADRVPAILVVEDEILMRLVICDYLRECGFRVYEAGNATEAIEILESDKATIDLVFSDVNMPGAMDGFGLAHWVRKNRPGLPITLTSGDSKKSKAAKDLCENEPFFAKPYDVRLVVAQIRTLIEARKPKSEG
jgi:CheY-like chemotaxis protein